jgi:hypothetical protein
LGRLVIFNNAEYGPYLGSTIQFQDDKGNVYPRFDRQIAWGDTCGVYYRYFRWPGGQSERVSDNPGSEKRTDETDLLPSQQGSCIPSLALAVDC